MAMRKDSAVPRCTSSPRIRSAAWSWTACSCQSSKFWARSTKASGSRCGRSTCSARVSAPPSSGWRRRRWTPPSLMRPTGRPSAGQSKNSRQSRISSPRWRRGSRRRARSSTRLQRRKIAASRGWPGAQRWRSCSLPRPPSRWSTSRSRCTAPSHSNGAISWSTSIAKSARPGSTKERLRFSAKSSPAISSGRRTKKEGRAQALPSDGFQLRMRQLPADGAPREERTAGRRLTSARRVDVDVVPGRVVLDVLDQGSVNVLLASAEGGGTGRGGEARVEEGHNDRSVDTGAAFVDVGSKNRSRQARDGDLPAHLVVSRIYRDIGRPASMAAQDGGKRITSVKRAGETLGGRPGRNERCPDDQQHDEDQLSHTSTSCESAHRVPQVGG